MVLHDWPEDFAHQILLQLRRAAGPDTKLVIAEHVLPYAIPCARPDQVELNIDFGDIEGAHDALKVAGARWPLLANLGTANANAYWLDLTVRCDCIQCQ